MQSQKTEALVQFNDAQVFGYRSSLGVFHRKTYTASIAPEFEKNRYFWCGFIEGDGTISAREDAGKTYWSMGWVGGSPIYSALPGQPDVIYLKTGTMDDTSGFNPSFNVWCSTKQDWVELPEGVLQMETQ